MLEDAYIKSAKGLLKRPLRQTRNAMTKSSFGKCLTIYDLKQGKFPILHGRQIFWKGIVGELAAFLKGPKSIEDFEAQGCNYWKLWGNDDGSINVDYGNSWLDFNGINQLEDVVNSIKADPFGRRHLISGWRPDNLGLLNLPCCHYAYQWYVTDDGYLDMMWHQRSADWMIGVPSDIILAAVWNILMAQTTGYKPGKIIMTFGDSHIYESHLDSTTKYLDQAEELGIYNDATWSVDPKATVFNFTPDMFEVHNYNPGEPIKFHLEA